MRKQCKKCKQSFEVSDSDIAFLERVSPRINGKIEIIPAPQLCPSCRLQRRLCFRNHNQVATHASSLSGKQIFSMFVTTAPFPVYSNEEWWGDSWDALDYALDFDFNRPFFEQWIALRNRVPHSARSVLKFENSDFCNNAGGLKNCYLVFNANESIDCMNCEGAYSSRDCLDCSRIVECELCYDCAECTRCYNLQSSDHCEDCSDSYFLSLCRSCRHCYGCVNLRRAEYCIFNKPVGKAAFEQFINQINLGSYHSRLAEVERFKELLLKNPRPHVIGTRTEESNGNYLFSCRQVKDSYFIRGGESLKYCFGLELGGKDCMDLTLFGVKAELIYDSAVCGINSQSLRFCNDCWDGSEDLTYCEFCIGCQSCFGCVGLRKKRFCVFNKQYSEAEYHKLVALIIAHMRNSNEWGEFFPAGCSPFPYNYTLAQRYFPLGKYSAAEQGLSWIERPAASSVKAVPASEIPDSIPVSGESLVVQSQLSGRVFRISSEEIRRLKSFNAPLPRLTYDERFEVHAKKYGGLELFPRACARSGATISSSYLPNAPYQIWNKELYDREFQ